MKKFYVFAIFLTAVLAASAVVSAQSSKKLEVNTQTGDVRVKSDPDFWVDSDITITDEATPYLTQVKKAISQPGEAVPINSGTYKKVGLEGGLHIRVTKHYSEGVVYNGKTVTTTGPYTEPEVVWFNWFLACGLLSLSLMAVSNLCFRNRKFAAAFAALAALAALAAFAAALAALAAFAAALAALAAFAAAFAAALAAALAAAFAAVEALDSNEKSYKVSSAVMYVVMAVSMISFYLF